MSVKGITTDENDNMKREFIEKYRDKTDDYNTNFSTSEPVNVLSENIDILSLNKIVNELKNTDFASFDGVIITHGTDTLGYSASIISLLLSGINIPVVFVSSNYILSEPNSNGVANFISAVNFIKLKKFSGVFSSYKNDGDFSRIFSASIIRQCDILTNDFSDGKKSCFGYFNSENCFVLANEKPITPKLFNKKILLENIDELSPNVLIISPFPTLDYENITPKNNIKAILISLYHAGTTCVKSEKNANNSCVDFAKKCIDKGISMYASPIFSDVKKYESTKILESNSIIPLYNLTFEMSFAKLLLAYSTLNPDLRKFILSENIAGECLL